MSTPSFLLTPTEINNEIKIFFFFHFVNCTTIRMISVTGVDR